MSRYQRDLGDLPPKSGAIASIDFPAVPTATKRERQRINREARRLAILEAEKRRKRNKTLRNVALLLVPVIVIFFLVRSGGDGNEEATGGDDTIQRTYSQPPAQTIDPNLVYTVEFNTSEGKFTAALDAKKYPIGVNNFVFLADAKFYDGLEVVRVAKDFVFQAGSPDNTQSGGPGYSVQAEVPTVVEGTKTYGYGTIAMAKSGTEPAGTAGSQFFVVTNPDGVDLPPDYAIVGKVTSGDDTIKAIGALYPESGGTDGPARKTVTMKQVKIVPQNPTSTSTGS